MILVTANDAKWAEFEELFSSHGIEVKRVSSKPPEIQASELERIVKDAAERAKRELSSGGEAVLVEDAGLFVDALRGFPGPYSSYVYSTIGAKGLLKLMEGVENRSAKFVSVLAYADDELGVLTFRGECRGRIAFEVRGSSGFGFDPVFVPDEGDGRTFAEMRREEKNRISHRARSVAAFASWYKLKSGRP